MLRVPPPPVSRPRASTFSAIGKAPARIRREEHQILYDDFGYDVAVRVSSKPYVDNLVQDWARSYYTKDAHVRAILAYGSPATPAPTDSSWAYTLDSLRFELGALPTVRSLNFLNELRTVHFEPGSSAGYGLIGKKGDNDNHRIALGIANGTVRQQVEREINDYSDFVNESTPDIGYTRTQLSYLPERLKVRNVFGEHFSYILLEGLAAQPVLNALLETETFIFIGADPKIAVPQLLRDIQDESSYYYAFDWKEFDATVQDWEIDAAFSVLAENINFGDDPVNDKYNRTAFNMMWALFKFRKILGPDGTLYWKVKSVPSGSFWTMIIDSIVNRNRITYLYHLQHRTSVQFIRTQGDDSIVKVDTDKRFNLPQAAEDAARMGWILNWPKVKHDAYVGNVSFLSRTVGVWSGEREVNRCERLFLMPEYPVETIEISRSRAENLWEDCGFRSNLLRDVVDVYRREGVELPRPEDIPAPHRPFTGIMMIK